MTSCIFKPGFLSGSNSAAPSRVNDKMYQNVFFPRIVSLSLNGIRMNQTSCLLAYLDHICRQCNACQIEAAVAADYEVYSEVPRETHYEAKVWYPQFWATWLQSFPIGIMFPSRSELPLETLLIFSIGLALRYAGHCPQWLLPPCGEGAACFSWTLWGCGNLDATIISKQQNLRPTQNWRMLLQFACLRAFVQLSLSSVTLISWKRLENERLRSTTPHTSHTEELDFCEPSCCWITQRFDVLFGLNGFHSRSSLCFDHAASFPEQFLDFRLYNPLDKFDEVIATECLVFAQESLRSKASEKAMLQHVVVSHIFQAYS